MHERAAVSEHICQHNSIEHHRVPTSIGYRSPILSLDCSLWRKRRMLWLQLHGFSACALFWLLWTSASTFKKVWRCLSEAHLMSQTKTVLRSMSIKYSDIKPDMCVTLWTCWWWWVCMYACLRVCATRVISNARRGRLAVVTRWWVCLSKYKMFYPQGMTDNSTPVVTKTHSVYLFQ